MRITRRQLGLLIREAAHPGGDSTLSESELNEIVPIIGIIGRGLAAAGKAAGKAVSAAAKAGSDIMKSAAEDAADDAEKSGEGSGSTAFADEDRKIDQIDAALGI